MIAGLHLPSKLLECSQVTILLVGKFITISGFVPIYHGFLLFQFLSQSVRFRGHKGFGPHGLLFPDLQILLDE